LPELGVQTDEALFTSGIFPPIDTYNVSVFKRQIPLMQMSYLGCLKAWLYIPVYGIVNPTVWNLRAPMLLAGAAAIALFALLLERVHGQQAAVFGAVLLACDTSFLLTVLFDWGPVALQIMLTVAALLLLARARPFWGFFCLGLALWNKALMLWTLMALAVPAILLLRRHLRPRLFPLAAAGFLTGALPFVLYNVRTGMATFRENSAWDFSDLPGKAELMRATLGGSGLFGFLVHEDHEPKHPLPPATTLDRFAYRISALTGRPRDGWLPYALAASAAALPFLWKTPARLPLLFALLAFTLGWIQMAITKGAGGSVHHAALLWPLPHMAVAITAAELSRRRRWAGGLAVAAVAVSSLLVTNQYYVQIRRNGGAGNWSDANFALADRLMSLRPTGVYLLDWGFYDTLRFHSRGVLKMDWALETPDETLVKSWIERPGMVFVAHSEGSETLEGRRVQLLSTASRLGYGTELLDTIYDRNRRPRFEIYRFSPPVTGSPGRRTADPARGRPRVAERSG
jgi:hypothetical protein